MENNSRSHSSPLLPPFQTPLSKLPSTQIWGPPHGAVSAQTPCQSALLEEIASTSFMTPEANYSLLSPTGARANSNGNTLEASPCVVGPGPPIMTGDRVKGPDGANLFCFHLPNDLTNWDLYLLFRKYGTILSVHIMVGKETGLSRGFGFVSYENKADADNAIAQMNGFRLGTKRLKVQHKRGGSLDDDDEIFCDRNWQIVSSGDPVLKPFLTSRIPISLYASQHPSVKREIEKQWR